MTAVMRAFFVASVVLLVLLALSLPTVGQDRGTFAVTVASFLMLGTVLVGSAACIYADWDPFEELFS